MQLQLGAEVQVHFERCVFSDLDAAAGSVDVSLTLRAIADFPLMSDDEKLDTLFIAALSRKSTESERASFGKFLKDGGTNKNPQEAMADVFWALLNGSEFLLNH